MKHVVLHNKNILELLIEFLNSLDEFRLCSKYLSRIVGRIYFSKITFNARAINKNNKHLFRKFVHKYALTINIKNVASIRNLSYFNTYKLNSISFSNNFNELYCEYFLPHIKTLTFENNFNKRIDKLPSSLINLHFGYTYNHSLNHLVLPSKLETLTFGYWFNKKLKKNILPQSLKKLDLGYGYNQQIKPNVLPIKLEYLDFGYLFNQPIRKNVLPTSLIHLKFGYWFNNFISELPINLKSLTFGRHYNKLILHEKLVDKFFEVPAIIDDALINILPRTLEHLVLPIRYKECFSDVNIKELLPMIHVVEYSK